MHGKGRVGTRAGIANRVLGEVPRDDAHHPRAHFGGRLGVAFEVERDARSRGLLLELGQHLLEHRQDRLGAERDDSRARFQLREKEHLVDQLADLVDLAACLLDELGHVLSGQAGELEQGEQPRERRPELVRDRRREARAELLVGGEIAGLGEVDEPLLPAVDRIGDDEGSLALQQVGAQLVALANAERLPRSPARGEHDSVVVEHDDRLAALLEQDLAPHRVRIDHFVTTPSPLDSPAEHA